MKKTLPITAILASVLLVTGCTHKKIETTKMTDNQLNCHELVSEITQTKALKDDIEEKRGFSGRNVGMALLFWPGVIVNEMNGSEAEGLADKRLENLTGLYNKNNCGGKKHPEKAAAEANKPS